MSASTPASLAALLQNLSLEDSHDHEEILRTANNILKSNPDPQTFKTRIVALIKLDRYDEAIKSIEQASGSVSAGLEFEHAYCLYKQGDLDGALSISPDGVSTERRQRGLKHLQAQAHYRGESFQSAITMYEELSKLPTLVENENYDLRVNLGASEAQLSFAGKDALRPKRRATAEDLQQYESAFNAACISVARGDLNAALMLLKTAKKICNSMEGVSEQDIQAELAPVIAQELYVLIKLGKLEEAIELYKTSGILETSDEAVKLVASANCYLASQAPNPHIGLRVLETLQKRPQGSQKPFTFQSDILERNAVALALQTGKENEALALAQKLKARNPNDYTVSSIVAATELQTSELTAAKSIAKTLKDAAGRKLGSTTDIGIAFINVQNYLKENNVTSAVAVVETLLKELENEPEKRYMPGLVGVIAGLYTLQGRKTKVKAELERASVYWRSTTDPDPAILLATGTAELASSNLQDRTMAASIFESLLGSNPTPLSNAGYIASHPAEDMPSKIAQLTPIPTLLKGVSIDNLLSAGVAAPPTKKRPLESTSSKPQVKPRKKRKIRLPKGGIDPTKKPDPERWLPLRDRSTYKPKGKKDKKRAKDLTQGGVVADKDGDTEMIGGNTVTKVVPQTNPVAKNKGKKKGGKRK
ncbi:Signal recognition particle subunit [Drechslerella dactyloides]|uniref:Signal recognition particle subunit SRP72 n=1 Tax=Drechslerella dactyloides TaxID=74499 RepID=A0AAD6NMF3_DREDA|nr:Signal recognition particle subunit [Drechslerella dactyloides]